MSYSICDRKSKSQNSTDIQHNQNSDPFIKVTECIKKGYYKKVEHAARRQIQRSISYYEIIDALKHGHHEPEHDTWNSEWKKLNYSIRGKTAEGKDLRIVVSLNRSGTQLMIITAIDMAISP